VPASVHVPWFQSTPPRGGEPDGYGSLAAALDVSIHAPARGRTRRSRNPPPAPAVSIHAPARGRTVDVDLLRIGSACCNPRPRAGANWPATSKRTVGKGFNPRPRAGANVLAAHYRDFLAVSIHAPARGRTQ